MSINKTIGVLLPVYRKDDPIHFKESVESILSQSYPKLMIYIGCDGILSEQLNNIISEYLDNSRIKIVRFIENRGLAAVLNDLLTLAKENDIEYLARMDADDIADKFRFEKQLNFLMSNPDIDVVGGAIEEIDENGNLRGKRVNYPRSHDACRKFFRYRDPLAHPATFFRRSFFDKVKGYRPEYRKNQDTILWFDGFRNGCRFSNIPDVVLKFRVNDSFYSRRDGFRRAKQMLKDRIKINKTLNYDLSAYIFALAMFTMTLSPKFIKRFLYKVR